MRDIDAPVPFSPTLPDVTTADTSRAFRSNTYIAFLVKNVKPWSARVGGQSTLSYPYVLVVSKENVGPLYFVTLEVSVFGTKCVGVFDSSGIHQNLGFDDSLDGEQAFVGRAISLAERKFEESFNELQPKNSIAQNKSPSRKKSWFHRLIGG